MLPVSPKSVEDHTSDGMAARSATFSASALAPTTSHGVGSPVRQSSYTAVENERRPRRDSMSVSSWAAVRFAVAILPRSVAASVA